jgi:hypothetical protein
MPIATGTIRDHAMIATVALCDVPAEGGGATNRDILQHFPLAARKCLAAGRAVSRTVKPKNIGQLERWHDQEAG